MGDDDHADERCVSLSAISQRQELSVKYLEMIVARLKKAGLVESSRGKEGGYRLCRSPEDYTVGEVLRSIEDNLAPVVCIKDGVSTCERAGACLTLPMGEFPSGQRGQTVNLLAMPSVVRIHLPPPKISGIRVDTGYFFVGVGFEQDGGQQAAKNMFVGDGWYNSPNFKPAEKGFRPEHAVLFQILLEYPDGTRQIIGSDAQVRTSPGPVLSSEMFSGELYDANLEQDGWDCAGFRDENWQNAIVAKTGFDNLTAQYGEPVRPTRKLPVAAMSCCPVAVCARITASTSPLSRFATALSRTVSRHLSAVLATPMAYGMLYCGNRVDFRVSEMLWSFRYRCAV